MVTVEMAEAVGPRKSSRAMECQEGAEAKAKKLMAEFKDKLGP